MGRISEPSPADCGIARLHLAVPGRKLGPVWYQGWARLDFHCASFDVILKVLRVNGHLLRGMKDKNDAFFCSFILTSKSGPDCRCKRTGPRPARTEPRTEPAWGCTVNGLLNLSLLSLQWHTTVSILTAWIVLGRIMQIIQHYEQRLVQSKADTSAMQSLLFLSFQWNNRSYTDSLLCDWHNNANYPTQRTKHHDNCNGHFVFQHKMPGTLRKTKNKQTKTTTNKKITNKQTNK